MDKTSSLLAKREYNTVTGLDGPLLFIENIHNVGYNELVSLTDPQGKERLGTVLEAADGMAVIQVFEGTMGLSLKDTRVRFSGVPLQLGVSKDMLGRVFDGIGRPLDKLPAPMAVERRDINGQPINPSARDYPQKFIQTGISAIDGMNTLIRGQKLPIFSGSGLAHNKLAAQIARQAKILGEDSSFAVVFAAMGIKYDVAEYFIRNFEETGALENVVLFLNLADDPPIERLVTPRVALTCAEHLAFDHGMHVLVVMTDMSNYCESLREIATIRGDIPSRKGYPGYLYSDLASIFERAGIIKGKAGSITQMPILTMPNDDITHPVPDLTGFITEGQIVLERDLSRRGIYPPIAGLPSLSRLMKDGIGKGMTREDHPHLASQLFAAYSRVKDVRALASVIGEEELTPIDHTYLDFGKHFEDRFLSQREDENRDIDTTLDIGWQVLSSLPKDELYRMTEEEIQKFYGK
ncbi:MAG: V-type ATP synthase subunit B [Candidatus Auribacter fodinae]|jgi:V/A-type H+-transporting ATPase subunit B|uniref:V-type ATP synthase beta chain n=1 Tax=Candidatus Auribacter fodinae TaxID=2093366 RepID=A0A3A4QZL2_9BACT|nr:MAG: V-type ATP synthase subunit B [Candidatus Auribacter fodinae]